MSEWPPENISFLKDTLPLTLLFPVGICEPVQKLLLALTRKGLPITTLFKNYYGPTMNAFEAAEKNEKAEELQRAPEALFRSQNKSTVDTTASINATFLRVTVLKGRGGMQAGYLLSVYSQKKGLVYADVHILH